MIPLRAQEPQHNAIAVWYTAEQNEDCRINVFLIYNVSGFRVHPVCDSSNILQSKVMRKKKDFARRAFIPCAGLVMLRKCFDFPREQTLTDICKVTILLKTSFTYAVISLSSNSSSCLYIEQLLHSASLLNWKAHVQILLSHSLRAMHYWCQGISYLWVSGAEWSEDKCLLWDLKCKHNQMLLIMRLYSRRFIQTVCTRDLIMEWKSNIRRTQSLKSLSSSCDKPVWTDAGLRDKTTSVSQLVAR